MTTRTFEGDLGSALRASALAHAERPAIWANGQRLTYREMFDRAARIAAALRQVGVRQGDKVAVLGHKTTTPYCAMMAALLAGCTYVPMNPLFKPERNGSILRASGATALVLEATCAAKLDQLLDALGDVPVITPDEGAVAVPGARLQLFAHDLPEADIESFDLARDVDLDQPANIMFTSGTTGVPKGVPISHRNINSYLQGIFEFAPHDETDRILQLVDVTFDPCTHEMFLSWLIGAELYAMPENAALLAPRAITQHAITSIFLIPSTTARMIQQGLVKPGKMTSLRVTFFCGEALPQPVAEAWAAGGPNGVVFNIYGPTEGTVAITWYPFDPQAPAEFPVVPIGRPFSTQRLALFDTDNREVETGGTGQMMLSGSQLTLGYWKSPELNAEKFVGIDGVRWYKTGDLGRWIEPHGFVFAGRADRQVKIRGYLVELQEIEGILRRVTGREEVAVQPWPMTVQGSYDGSVAWVAGPPLDEAEVRKACREHVGDYMTPDRITFVEALPLNSNGKTDYKALAAELAGAG